MTGDELRAWRHRHNIQQWVLAERLGYERTIIWRWERGERPIPKWLPLALEQILRDMEDEKRRQPES